jgi:hypothetical protein
MLSFTLLQLSETGYFVLLAGLFFFPLLVAVVTAKDIFFNDNLTQNTKLLWVIIVVLIPLLGAMIYYLWGKPAAQNKNL